MTASSGTCETTADAAAPPDTSWFQSVYSDHSVVRNCKPTIAFDVNGLPPIALQPNVVFGSGYGAITTPSHTALRTLARVGPTHTAMRGGKPTLRPALSSPTERATAVARNGPLSKHRLHSPALSRQKSGDLQPTFAGHSASRTESQQHTGSTVASSISASQAPSKVHRQSKARSRAGSAKHRFQLALFFAAKSRQLNCKCSDFSN